MKKQQKQNKPGTQEPVNTLTEDDMRKQITSYLYTWGIVFSQINNECPMSLNGVKLLRKDSFLVQSEILDGWEQLFRSFPNYLNTMMARISTGLESNVLVAYTLFVEMQKTITAYREQLVILYQKIHNTFEAISIYNSELRSVTEYARQVFDILSTQKPIDPAVKAKVKKASSYSTEAQELFKQGRVPESLEKLQLAGRILLKYLPDNREAILILNGLRDLNNTIATTQSGDLVGGCVGIPSIET